MEHLALERVGLVLASAYEVCSASAVAVVKALKAPILVEDAPAHDLHTGMWVLISLGLVCVG